MPPAPGQKCPAPIPKEGSSTIVRKWTLSACVVLAWCLLALVAAASMRGPSNPVAQANTSTATSTSTAGSTSTASSTRVILASESVTAVNAKVTAAPAARPAATWTVRPGDTLSAIAAAVAVPGGWQSLYAANRAAIGPDPNVIHAGIVLVVPGRQEPARYTVAPGDTLSAIAAALGVRGGWQALYAANKGVVGPDPNVIQAGAVLSVPRPSVPAGAKPAARQPIPRAAAPAPSAARRPHASAPAPAASGHPVSSGHPAQPGNLARPGHPTATVAGGMPRWLEDVLLAAGVLAATAFAAEPAAALARRRRHAVRSAPPRASTGVPGPRHAPGAVPGPARDHAGRARIILADHDRLVVTYCARDHAVYVLAPPGQDPRTVLGAARLVLPEATYEDLAGHLGVPSGWPLE
jgi:LysM repeat protein